MTAGCVTVWRVRLCEVFVYVCVCKRDDAMQLKTVPCASVEEANREAKSSNLCALGFAYREKQHLTSAPNGTPFRCQPLNSNDEGGEMAAGGAGLLDLSNFIQKKCPGAVTRL